MKSTGQKSNTTKKNGAGGAKSAAAPTPAPTKKASGSTKAGKNEAPPAKKNSPPKKESAPILPAKPKKNEEVHNDLTKLLKGLLKDIYYAEKKLVKALGKMAKAATNEDLKDAFETHQEETEGHVEKLEEVFEKMEMRAQGKTCHAMDGLVEEGQEEMQEYSAGPTRDAAMIVSAQKIEHYEIAAYGSLRNIAEDLGLEDIAEIFEEILEEEKETDEILTEHSRNINMEALEGHQEEEEDEDEDEDDDDDDDDDDNDLNNEDEKEDQKDNTPASPKGTKTGPAMGM